MKSKRGNLNNGKSMQILNSFDNISKNKKVYNNSNHGIYVTCVDNREILIQQMIMILFFK